MNQGKIEILKQKAAQANAAYSARQAELVAAGYKSQERYSMLKELKTAADAAHSEYANFAKGQILKELNEIIAADRPMKEAAARERSAWKMHKYNAAQAAK